MTAPAPPVSVSKKTIFGEMFFRQAPMFADADKHADPDNVIYYQMIAGKTRLYGHSTLESFLMSYLAQNRIVDPVFELLRESDLRKWRRLHFDIDRFHDTKPSSDDQKQGLIDTLSKIRGHLRRRGCPAEKCQSVSIINGSRQTETRYKESYHIVFTNVIFLKNNELMKEFVQQVCTDVDCDSKIYTKNRVFRLPYSPKKTGGDPLVPWDMEGWTKKSTTTTPERLQILKLAMISTSDSSECFILSESNIALPNARKRKANNALRPHEIPSKRQQLEMESWKPDLSLHKALMLLGCLTSEYIDDYNNWIKTGFIIIGLFREAPQLCKALFHWISRRSSSKYNTEACSHKFVDLWASHVDGKYERPDIYRRLWKYAFMCNSHITRIVDDRPSRHFISNFVSTAAPCQEDRVRVFVLALGIRAGTSRDVGEATRGFQYLRNFIRRFLPAEYPLLFQIVTHGMNTTTETDTPVSLSSCDMDTSLASASSTLLSLYSGNKVATLRCKAIIRQFT